MLFIRKYFKPMPISPVIGPLVADPHPLGIIPTPHSSVNKPPFHPSFRPPSRNLSRGVGVPFALSGVEGLTERNGVASPPPTRGRVSGNMNEGEFPANGCTIDQ